MLLRKGFARWNASTQQFLDTCPAVKSWAPTNDGKFVVFTYDTAIEVPLTPPGVYFDPDRADEDEREELAASLRWPRSGRTTTERGSKRWRDTY